MNQIQMYKSTRPSRNPAATVVKMVAELVSWENLVFCHSQMMLFVKKDLKSAANGVIEYYFASFDWNCILK